MLCVRVPRIAEPASTYTLAADGAGGNNTKPLVGYISEIVILASIASAFVRQTSEGYLVWGWGLAQKLSATHPFANRPPLIGD